MSSEFNAILQQQPLTDVPREYHILNGKEVRIIEGLGHKQRVYLIHILALADKSRIRIGLAWGWLWWAIVCVVSLVLYLFISPLFPWSSTSLHFVIIASLVIASILGVIMLGVKLSRKRVFYARHSQVPLFDILIAKPDQQRYKAFVDQLASCMEKARSGRTLRLDQQIAGEIRMLRRLANEGVIAKRDYEQAKAQLFSLSNKKSSV